MLFLVHTLMILAAVTSSFLVICFSFQLSMFKGSFILSFFDVIGFLDGKSSIFIGLVLFISLLVFSWGEHYMSGVYKLSAFFITLLLFVFSMVVLLFSDSLLMLFLGWEGLGISSFVLIIFYQNWMSAKGGLLTLLTNRVGDGLLIVSFALWWSSSFFSLTLEVSLVLMLMILFVSYTKSAQWPFMNWLPAAMAAPTPVSALVHSSTLVTAGVWLMIRFKQSIWGLSSLWITIGMGTLLLASVAAFLESDGKKVVALSTLSQLGLMVFSLGQGNAILCLFHVVTHAAGKANLFLIVGNFLHSGLSQQDSRKLSLMGESFFMLVALSASVLSLSGAFFMSGFFSKEQIIVHNYFVGSSSLSPLALVLVSSLTLGYCIKLMFSLSWLNMLPFLNSAKMPAGISPILILSTTTILLGFLLSLNLELAQVIAGSMMGYYWGFLFWFIVFIMVLVNWVFVLMGFSLNDRMLDLMNSSLVFLKKLSGQIEPSIVEPFYLTVSLGTYKWFSMSLRSILIISMSLFVFFLVM